MRSKIGYMLARIDEDGKVWLFPSKRIGDKSRERIALIDLIETPKDAIDEPQSADFIWSTMDLAEKSDGEWAGGKHAIVKVEGFWNGIQPPVSRPDGYDVHIIPETIIVLHVRACYPL